MDDLTWTKNQVIIFLIFRIISPYDKAKTMKSLVILFYSLFVSITALSQAPFIDLTFTAVNNTTHIQMDSIKVMNRTQGGDTVLYWPDTILSIYFVDIPEPEQETPSFKVYQNYPNPVTDRTTITIYVPEKDKVSAIITDILGNIVIKSDRMLDKGFHSFRFSPGSGNLYFFTARWRGNSCSIKILQAAFNTNRESLLEYIGNETLSSQLKTTNDIQSFIFSLGDTMLYIGYSDTLQSGMLDSPEESKIYIFQFATSIPCPGMPTLEYEGQTYNTIQIFSQCWLKENLNVGTMIQAGEDMTDNGFIEKYCYYNQQDSCTKFGGFYQWREMMQYTTQQGARGICPDGWHLPTDEEWKILEGSVDSNYGIGDPEWDPNMEWQGFNAGTNLKTTNSWLYGGNGTDLFGFSCQPAGYCLPDFPNFHGWGYENAY
jgi:uncharacterized protein (TIGR02145 family)